MVTGTQTGPNGGTPGRSYTWDRRKRHGVVHDDKGGHMSNYCVVVAGGGEARFFTLEGSELPELESGPSLVEHEVLINPEKGMHGGELWSDDKSGRNRGPSGAHGYDDHREQHAEELLRRFAHSVAGKCAEVVQRSGAKHLVLVAEKHMLGHLRKHLEGALKDGVSIRESAKELSRLPAAELHAHLAKEALLPERKGPAM